MAKKDEVLFTVKIDWKVAYTELGKMEKKVASLTNKLETEFTAAEKQINESLDRIGTAAESALDADIGKALEMAMRGAMDQGKSLEDALRSLIETQVSLSAAMSGTQDELQKAATKHKGSAAAILEHAASMKILDQEQANLLRQSVEIVESMNALIVAYNRGGVAQEELQSGLEQLGNRLRTVRELMQSPGETTLGAEPQKLAVDPDAMKRLLEQIVENQKAAAKEKPAEPIAEITEEAKEAEKAVEKVAEEIAEIPQPEVEIVPTVDPKQAQEQLEKVAEGEQLTLPLNIEPAGDIIDEAAIKEEVQKAETQLAAVKENIEQPIQLSFEDALARKAAEEVKEVAESVKEVKEEAAKPVELEITPPAIEETKQEVAEVKESLQEVKEQTEEAFDDTYLREFAGSAAGVESIINDLIAQVGALGSNTSGSTQELVARMEGFNVKAKEVRATLKELAGTKVKVAGLADMDSGAVERMREALPALINDLKNLPSKEANALANELIRMGQNIEGVRDIVQSFSETPLRPNASAELEQLAQLNTAMEALTNAGINLAGMEDNDIINLFNRMRENINNMSGEWVSFLSVLSDAGLPSGFMDGIGEAEEGTEGLLDLWRQLSDMELENPEESLLRIIRNMVELGQVNVNLDSLESIDETAREAAKGTDEMRASVADAIDGLNELGKGGIGTFEKAMQILSRGSEASQGIRDTAESVQQLNVAAEPSRLEKLALANRQLSLQAAQSVPNVRNAEAAWRLLLNQFPKFSDDLQRLADRMGGLRLTLNSTNPAVKEHRDSFERLLRRYPEVSSEIDQLIAKYRVLNATVEKTTRTTDKEGKSKGGGNFLSSLISGAGGSGRIGGALAGLGKLAAGGGVIGLAVGGITALINITDRLFDSVIRLVEQGWMKLKDVISESINEARRFQSIQASFESVIADFASGGSSFGKGMEGAADQFGNKLGQVLALEGRKFSEQFGTDVTDTWRRILTQVGDVDLAAQFLKAIPGLRAAAPDLPANRSGLALQELIAQDWQPLRRAFELPTTNLQKVIKTTGDLNELAQTLNDTLNNLGLGFESQADTYIVQVGQLTEAFKTLKIMLGTNILEAIEDQLPGVKEALGGQREEIYELVEAFGVLMRTAIAFGGDVVVGIINSGIIEFFTNLITMVSQGVNTFAKYVEVGAKLIGIHRDMDRAGERFVNWIGRMIEGIKNFATAFIPFVKLEDAVKGLVARFFEASGASEEFMASLRRYMDDGLPLIERLRAGWDVLRRSIRHVTAEIVEAKTFFGLLGEVASGPLTLAEALEIAEQAQNDFLEKASELDEKYAERFYEIAEASDAVTEAFTNTSKAALAVATAILTIQSAQDTLDELAAEVVEIGYKYNEMVLDLEQSLVEAREDINIDYMRRIVDLEADLARARIKIEEDYYKKLEDLDNKYQEGLEDALTDLQRKFEDIDIDIGRDLFDADVDRARDVEDAYIDYIRKLEDIDRDAADKRIKIEVDYWEEVEKIRRKFEEEIEEALRRNDATALLRARRRAAQDLAEARRKRDKELKEEEDDREKKRRKAAIDRDRDLEDIERDLAREREDIARNEDRKRADAIKAYNEQRADLALALARRKADLEDALKLEREELAENESLKRQELQTAYDRQLEDLMRNHTRRLEEIGREMDKEIEVIKQKEKQKFIAMQNAIDTLSKYTVEQLALLTGFSEEAVRQILDDMDKLREEIDRRRGELGIPENKYGIAYPSEIEEPVGGGTPNPVVSPQYPLPGETPEPTPPPGPQPTQINLPQEVVDQMPENFGETPLPEGWQWGSFPGGRQYLVVRRSGFQYQVIIPYDDGKKPFIKGYAEGGRTPSSNVPFMVGERGPEIMSNTQAGYVNTLDDFMTRLYMRNAAPQMEAPSYVYNNNYSTEINMVDPTRLTLQQQAEVKNIVVDLLKEAFAR